MPRFLTALFLLLFSTSCLSFWPWLHSKPEVKESYQDPDADKKPKIKIVSPRRPHMFLRKAITRREKLFDANGDGRLGPEEVRRIKKADRARENEKRILGIR